MAFLTQYAGILKVVAAIAAFLAGMFFGMHLKQGTIDDLNQQVGALQASYKQLKVASDAQSKAVLDLKQAGEDRAKAAAEELAKAKAATRIVQNKITKILTSRPPEGANVCDAASAAFDEELKEERGIK